MRTRQGLSGTLARIAVSVVVAFVAPGEGRAQVARVYYQGLYYQGPSVDFYAEGDEQIVVSDGDEFSVEIFDSAFAMRIENLGPANYNDHSDVPFYGVLYVDRDLPELFGTDQYDNGNTLLLTCVRAADSWEALPQPEIYIPIDISTVNQTPDGENDTKPNPAQPGHRQLVLRRAYFWENSEDETGFHAPYADIKIGAYDVSVLDYSELDLVNHVIPWSTLSFIRASTDGRLFKTELPGPIWGGYAPIIYPDPYDEWIDGPFGAVYSNIIVMDWGLEPDPDDAVAVLVDEADSEGASYMGRVDDPITPFTEGPIFAVIWGFGFVVLENVWIPDDGERNFASADVYWYGGWDGEYPAKVYGPTNEAVPFQESYGSQYKPFTDEMFFDFESDPAFDGWTVGLVGGDYPATALRHPRTYVATDPDRPAVFGR